MNVDDGIRFEITINHERGCYIWTLRHSLSVIAFGRTLDFPIAVERAGRALLEHGQELAKPVKQ